ncbi:putative Ubiquitin-protein ligase E3A [Blattamonas nauphoetae]|uniref:HECT-type E3 ubiquitin transferase n=1 Tax=Blattamonas nauphoetae TaxID=2049346 RepID=A0ABQ9YGC9_9EUKA|nr:putative Ubiquitin-protein ligase E3A [Blattamonas nauphoetae]
MNQQQKAKIRFNFYYRQMTEGCCNPQCSNPFCSNNKSFVKPTPDKLTATIREQMNKNNFCPVENWIPEIITFQTIPQLLDLCTVTQNTDSLPTIFSTIFCDHLHISQSFRDLPPFRGEQFFRHLLDSSDDDSDILSSFPPAEELLHHFNTIYQYGGELPGLSAAIEAALANLLNTPLELADLINSIPEWTRIVPIASLLLYAFTSRQRPVTELSLIPSLDSDAPRPYLPTNNLSDTNMARILSLSTLVSSLSPENRATLRKYFMRMPNETFVKLLSLLHSYLDSSLSRRQSILNVEAKYVCDFFELLFSALLRIRDLPVSSQFAPPLSVFYSNEVSEMDPIREYKRYRNDEFCFMRYPFLFKPEVKLELFKVSAENQKYEEVMSGGLLNLLMGRNPYLNLHVRRDHVIEDTLIFLQSNSESLHRPLRVHFDGEPGVDEGGVSKEFFSLITEQICNPNYGMFKIINRQENPETSDETEADKPVSPGAGLYWFSSIQSEDTTEYSLIGTLCGLALYNEVIIEPKFPLALFRALLGKRATLGDLEEMSPSSGESLARMFVDGTKDKFFEKAILTRRAEGTLGSYEPPDITEDKEDDDVWANIGLTFSVEQENEFGAMSTIELVPQGGEIPVTKSNKNEYVLEYLKYFTDSSVRIALNEFKRGFTNVVEDLLHILQPEELSIIICGETEFNFKDLRDKTKYDGYDADSPTIQAFWKIVESFSRDEQKKLLKFITSSDRAPAGGLKTVKLVIKKNGGRDSDQLPTAHTCFNVLMLPDYQSESKLRKVLMQAIENAEGFGLM